MPDEARGATTHMRPFSTELLFKSYSTSLLSSPTEINPSRPFSRRPNSKPADSHGKMIRAARHPRQDAQLLRPTAESCLASLPVMVRLCERLRPM